MGNKAFKGLSDLAVDMDLEREAVEPADAGVVEVRALLLEGEAAWMAETNESVARRLVNERREKVEVEYRLWADFMDEMAGPPTDFNCRVSSGPSIRSLFSPKEADSSFSPLSLGGEC